MTPLFIILDGPDGAGKTTQIVALASRLRDLGRQVVETAEPSKGPIGLYIRRHLHPETPPEVLACLFAGDRKNHLQVEVEPALTQGLDVVCDRYIPSSLAYQGEIAEGLNRDFRRPDLTLILKLSPGVAMSRLAARGGADAWELDRQTAAHAGYVRAAETLRTWGWTVVEVDAEGSPAEVEARIWSAVKGLLEQRQEGPSSASAIRDVAEDGGVRKAHPWPVGVEWYRCRRGVR